MVENQNEQTKPNPETEPEIPMQGGDEAKAIPQEQIASGQVVSINDLQDELEYTQTEFDELVEMYDQTMSDFVEGELVKGKILAISDKEVAVDIGFKSEGSIPIDEFSDIENLEIGDEIEVFLDEIEDKEGQLVLSKKKADFMRIWDKICNSCENDEILQGKCIRRIKGGIVVDLMGVDAFLPGSQIDVRPIRDFDAFIGKNLDLKVVKINNLRKNIVVSHRVLVEQEIAGQRQKILNELERNQVLEGTVKNITDFGVFIDLGGVDGLLHINDLSWGRVNHPSEVVQLDEKLKVMVLDFNEDKDRISLGLKQLQPHPWENVEEKYPVGAKVQGKVVSISDYGAFVELEKGVEGLIHISEMSWTQHIKHPSKVVNVGETVEAIILNIQKDERKISLGLKQMEPDPWETLEQRYPIGSRHTGKVRNLTNFGAFIELEEGIDGLVHISDLSWTKKIRHPSEVLKKGGEVDVVVLNVDREHRRISLGFKQTSDSPWDYFEDKYKPGTLTNGKVVRLIEKGVIVELPDDVDGFVPISHLAKQVNKPADGYQVDDTIELRVIEFNKENKKIVLSEKRALESTKPAAGEKKEETKADAAAAEEVSTQAETGEKVEAAPVEEKAEATEAVEEAAEEVAPEAVESVEEAAEKVASEAVESVEEAAGKVASEAVESVEETTEEVAEPAEKVAEEAAPEVAEPVEEVTEETAPEATEPAEEVAETKEAVEESVPEEPEEKAAAPKKSTKKKAAPASDEEPEAESADAEVKEEDAAETEAKEKEKEKPAPKKTRRRSTSRKKAETAEKEAEEEAKEKAASTQNEVTDDSVSEEKEEKASE